MFFSTNRDFSIITSSIFFRNFTLEWVQYVHSRYITYGNWVLMPGLMYLSGSETRAGVQKSIAVQSQCSLLTDLHCSPALLMMTYESAVIYPDYRHVRHSSLDAHGCSWSSATRVPFTDYECSSCPSL